MNILKSLNGQHDSIEDFLAVTIRSLKRYIQPKLEENEPNKMLLHVGNNDPSSLQNVNVICSEVMGIVDICKGLKINIFISEIVARGDDLNVKGNTLNKCVKKYVQLNQKKKFR